MARTRQLGIQRLLLGLVLAVGGAFVWTLLVAEAGSWLSERILRRTARDSYWIHYRQSGEPVIGHIRYSSSQVIASQTFETLEGETVELFDHERNRSWYQAWMVRPFDKELFFHLNGAPGGWPRRMVDLPEPLPWSIRLWDCSASFDRLGHWTLVWPERWSGSAYLAGFDPKTKASRGYIGRNGWQETKPTTAEGFPVGQPPKDGLQPRVARLANSLPQAIFPSVHSQLMVLSEDRDPDVGMFWLNAQCDELSLINLTKQSVKVARTFHDASLRGIATKSMDHNVARTLLPSTHQGFLQPKLILLWSDHLEFVSPTMQTLSKVTLPDELRGNGFQFTELADGRFLGQWHTHREILGGQGYFEEKTHIVWFTETGEVTKRHTFTPPLPQWTTWQRWALQWQADVYPPATLMPLGLTSMGLQWLRTSALVSSTPNQSGSQPMFWQVLRRAPWTIGLTLLSGLPFAVACWRRQRRVASTTCERIVWPVLVYLFGLAGWIAFATHRNWPARRAPH